MKYITDNKRMVEHHNHMKIYPRLLKYRRVIYAHTKGESPSGEKQVKTKINNGTMPKSLSNVISSKFVYFIFYVPTNFLLVKMNLAVKASNKGVLITCTLYFSYSQVNITYRTLKKKETNLKYKETYEEETAALVLTFTRLSMINSNLIKRYSVAKI